MMSTFNKTHIEFTSVHEIHYIYVCKIYCWKDLEKRDLEDKYGRKEYKCEVWEEFVGTKCLGIPWRHNHCFLEIHKLREMNCIVCLSESPCFLVLYPGPLHYNLHNRSFSFHLLLFVSVEWEITTIPFLSDNP